MNSRLVLTFALLAGALPALQGCFPIVAGGIAAGALAIDDRRTLATQAEDKTIFAKAETRISERSPNGFRWDVPGQQFEEGVARFTKGSAR